MPDALLAPSARTDSAPVYPSPSLSRGAAPDSAHKVAWVPPTRVLRARREKTRGGILAAVQDCVASPFLAGGLVGAQLKPEQNRRPGRHSRARGGGRPSPRIAVSDGVRVSPDGQPAGMRRRRGAPVRPGEPGKTRNPTEGEGPLSGPHLVDLSTMVKAPYCTKITADLSADVVKIEPSSVELDRHLRPGLHATGLGKSTDGDAT